MGFYKIFEVLRDNILNRPKNYNSKLKVSDIKQLRPQSLLMHEKWQLRPWASFGVRIVPPQIHITLKRSGIRCLHRRMCKNLTFGWKN